LIPFFCMCWRRIWLLKTSFCIYISDHLNISTALARASLRSKAGPAHVHGRGHLRPHLVLGGGICSGLTQQSHVIHMIRSGGSSSPSNTCPGHSYTSWHSPAAPAFLREAQVLPPCTLCTWTWGPCVLLCPNDNYASVNSGTLVMAARGRRVQVDDGGAHPSAVGAVGGGDGMAVAVFVQQWTDIKWCDSYTICFSLYSAIFIFDSLLVRSV
jgi:hypothetical protein